MTDSVSEKLEVAHSINNVEPVPQFLGHILLVEDLPLNQKVATYMLENLGCTVDIANTGHEAIDLVATGNFDLIFMDVGLPDKSGLDVTRQLRKNKKADNTPIVAMTAHAMEQDIRRCLDAGMDDVITKPVLEPEVREILKKYIG